MYYLYCLNKLHRQKADIGMTLSRFKFLFLSFRFPLREGAWPDPPQSFYIHLRKLFALTLFSIETPLNINLCIA